MERRQRQIQPTDLKAKAVWVVVRELREQAGHSAGAPQGRVRVRPNVISAGRSEGSLSDGEPLWEIAEALKTPLSQIA